MIPDVGLFALSPVSYSELSSRVIFFVLIFVVPLWLLCKKLGINPYLSFLLIVPVVGAFIFWIFYLRH